MACLLASLTIITSLPNRKLFPSVNYVETYFNYEHECSSVTSATKTK